MIKKRIDGTPVQYITRKCNFMGIDLHVGPGVLIPRDDTEVLVQNSKNFILSTYKHLKRPLNVIDLCSGSGAIAIAIKKELGNKVNVSALELSDSAFKYLESNVYKSKLDINLIKGDVFKSFSKFSENEIDFIISNPPYIPTNDLRFLSSDVKMEPKIALDGGKSGLDFYVSICNNWLTKLVSGGKIAVEIGLNQKESVVDIFKRCKLKNIEVVNDISNIPRVVIGQK